MTELICFGHSIILFFSKPLSCLPCSFDTIYPLSFLQTFHDPPVYFLYSSFSPHNTLPTAKRIFSKIVNTAFSTSQLGQTNVRGKQTQGSTVILFRLCNLPLWSNKVEAVIHTHPRTLGDHKMLVISLKWDAVSQSKSYSIICFYKHAYPS